MFHVILIFRGHSHKITTGSFFFLLSSPCASDTATTQRMCQNIPFTWTDLVLKCVLQDILKEEKQEKVNQPNKAPSGGKWDGKLNSLL